MVNMMGTSLDLNSAWMLDWLSESLIIKKSRYIKVISSVMINVQRGRFAKGIVVAS